MCAAHEMAGNNARMAKPAFSPPAAERELDSLYLLRCVYRAVIYRSVRLSAVIAANNGVLDESWTSPGSDATPFQAPIFYSVASDI